MSEDKAAYDVFMSYASNDKICVQQLVHALRAQGLTVWYDEGQLRILAGKQGISTEDHSIDEIAGLVAKVVKDDVAVDDNQ